MKGRSFHKELKFALVESSIVAFQGLQYAGVNDRGVVSRSDHILIMEVNEFLYLSREIRVGVDLRVVHYERLIMKSQEQPLELGYDAVFVVDAGQ